MTIDADTFERARLAFVAEWERRNTQPDLQPTDRTKAGLVAALRVIGVTVHP